MGDLTKNISRHELQCTCGCGLDSMDWETIDVWQRACDHFAEQQGVPKAVLTITSAARCYAWNRTPVAQGGPGSNDASQHPRCRAIDGRIKGVTPEALYTYFNTQYPDVYGIGLYAGFVHLDTRKGRARW